MVSEVRGAVPLRRRVGQVCVAVLSLHAALSAALLLYARLGHDTLFDAHWRWSKPVLMGRKSGVLQRSWRHWRDGQLGPSVLTDEEQRCVQAWLDVMRLDLPPDSAREVSPHILVQDTLTSFDGLAELRDGVCLLQRCLHAVSPTLLEVRRETQKDAVLLHCKVDLELAMRVPFTRRVFVLGHLPSTSTLQLERWPTLRSRLAITAAEHRWFGGPIFSHQTGTVRSPWGDVGDLWRRYSGFMLSVLLTQQQDISRHLHPLRLAAADIAAEVKAQQESQIQL